MAECATLRVLNINQTAVTDLSPLRGKRELTHLSFARTRVADLTPLRGLPLRAVRADATAARDVTPLLECAALEHIGLPFGAQAVEALRKLPALRRIAYSWLEAGDEPTFSAQTFWASEEARVAQGDAGGSLAELFRKAGLAAKVNLEADGTLSVDVSNQPLSDLTLLEGLPISSLSLNNTPVSDLAPLHRLPLKSLNLNACKAVADLSPLAGLPLTRLLMDGVAARDFEPLRKLPLRDFSARATALADLSPLSEAPLWTVALAETAVHDLAPLRGKPITTLSLQRLSNLNLSVLPSLRLRDLRLQGAQLTPENVRAIAACQEVEVLSLPANLPDYRFLAEMKLLRSVSLDDLAEQFQARDSVVASLQNGVPKRNEARARLDALLKASKAAAPCTVFPDGTLGASFEQSTLADLAPLAGLPIAILTLNSCPVTDLAPLRGLPLRELRITNAKVKDLRPLAVMELRTLVLDETLVEDRRRCKGRTSSMLRLPGAPSGACSRWPGNRWSISI